MFLTHLVLRRAEEPEREAADRHIAAARLGHPDPRPPDRQLVRGIATAGAGARRSLSSALPTSCVAETSSSLEPSVRKRTGRRGGSGPATQGFEAAANCFATSGSTWASSRSPTASR